MKHENLETIHHVDKFNKQQTANRTCTVCQTVCDCQKTASNTPLGINYFGVGRINDRFEF